MSGSTNVWDQLTQWYNNFFITGATVDDVTFSTAMIGGATLAADSNGDGGSTLTPTGTTWTQDPAAENGTTPAPVQITPATTDGATPDAPADAAGMLQFNILNPDGTVETTIYGQVIGWNADVIAFQAFSSYTPSVDGLTPGTFSGSVTNMPYFYVSASTLGSDAVPVDNTAALALTDIAFNNPVQPVFLDPQLPTPTDPLLLNATNGELVAISAGNTAPPFNLVGQSLPSDNVAAVTGLTQDPTSLIISVPTGDSDTFTTLGYSGISVIAGYNDDQVIELQYEDGTGTVDIFGKLISVAPEIDGSSGELLFQSYSNYIPVTGTTSGTLTHGAADASLPYFVLSDQSLAGSGPSDFNPTTADTATGVSTPFSNFDGTTSPGLATSLLNLHGLLNQTFSSDQFAVSDSSVASRQFGDGSDWTDDPDPTVGGLTASGQGTEETVQVAAVYDDWQVVQFTVSGGPQGTQTLYGQVLGWNAGVIAFDAFSSFSDQTGPSGSLSDGNLTNFLMAETAGVFENSSGADGFGYNNDKVVVPQNASVVPLFLNPSTPQPDLDLTPLLSTSPNPLVISSTDVGIVGAVEQDPTTLALSAAVTAANSTFATNNFYGANDPSSAGSIVIPFVDNQYQVAEVQWVPTGSNTPSFDVLGKVIGYNADSLLLQVQSQASNGTFSDFSDNNGQWTPDTSQFETTPFLVISDASLTATNGIPADDSFTATATAALVNSGIPLTQVCFCAGTLIATPAGEVKIEQLAVADQVKTLTGQARRIVWIGQGQVMVSRGRRSAATPVIVRKGALADNVPHHDLRVTKGHSFYLDGVLIPVEFLVNHRSIVWDDMAQEVTIYHVELDSHDVLLANGAPAESYRDDGNRWLFQTANGGWDQPAKQPYAPVLTGGPIVDQAWRVLLDRAGARRGFPLTDDADLHLLVDGLRIDAIAPQPMVRVFALPAVFGSVRLVSRSTVPAELGLARDPRELGVAVQRVVLRRGTWFRTVEAADATLGAGFHAYEPLEGIRWTDGDAALPAELLANAAAGPLELVVQLGGATRYVDYGQAAACAA